MHENKYLHLPVVDIDAGTVVGVVNVMEILQATAGDKGSARLHTPNVPIYLYNSFQETYSASGCIAAALHRS